MKKIFLITFLLLSAMVFPQQDCAQSITVCGNSGFVGLTASGSGVQELAGVVQCGSEENNSVWLEVKIATSGTLAFTLKPESTDINEDFDFFMFGPNATCSNLGPTLRCSTTNPQASGQSTNWTGMSDSETDTSEGPAALGNSFLKSLQVVAGQSYFLIIDRPHGGSDFNIEWTGSATFFEPPTLDIPPGTTIDLEKCASATQSTQFDLTQNTPIIQGSQTGVTVTYHRNTNDAITGDNPILNPTQFTNTTSPQTIFARISNNLTGCSDFTQFTLTAKSSVSLRNRDAIQCDDLSDGDNTNGITTFDLDAVTTQLFANQNVPNLDVAYFANPTQAATHLPADELPRFLYTPTNTTIYISMTNGNGCYNVQPITLTVSPIPTAVNASLTQCDTGLNPDGKTLFNLLEATASITQNNPDLTVTYFENNVDAQNNQNAITTITNTVNSQQIITKITDTVTDCSSFGSLTLIVNVSPSLENTLENCDSITQENGLSEFDLSQHGFTLSPTQTIVFYKRIDDALLEQNAIPDPIHFQNSNAYAETVYARIEDANSCSAIHTLQLVVNKLPNILTQGGGSDFVCLNLPQQYIPLNAGLLEGFQDEFNYEWFFNGNSFAFQYSVQVNKAGTYTVDVTNRSGCVKTRTIEVLPSNEATIASVDIVDVNDMNSVTIHLTPASIGNYRFSIDDPQGPYQSDNFFDNVLPGFHEIYVNDVNGCGQVSQTIAVIGVPKFFTPNGDGYNDFWTMKGVLMPFANKTRLYIYDRFGKFIKEIATKDSEGWDGTLNGNPLPADDYWYVAFLDDGRSVKGHFALKR